MLPLVYPYGYILFCVNNLIFHFFSFVGVTYSNENEIKEIFFREAKLIYIWKRKEKSSAPINGMPSLRSEIYNLIQFINPTRI